MTTAELILGIAQLCVPLVGFWLVWKTLAQKTDSDKRSEWWRRFSWAVDKTESDNEETLVAAWEVLALLGASELATDSEQDIIDSLTFWQDNATLDSDVEVGDNEPNNNHKEA